MWRLCWGMYPAHLVWDCGWCGGYVEECIWHISCGIVDDVEAMLKSVSGTSRVGLLMMWRLCWRVYLAHLVWDCGWCGGYVEVFIWHILCGIMDDVDAMLRCVSGTSRVGLWMMWRLCWGVYLAHLMRVCTWCGGYVEVCIWHISCGNVDDVEAMLRCVSSTSRVGLWMMWRLCWSVNLAHLVWNCRWCGGYVEVCIWHISCGIVNGGYVEVCIWHILCGIVDDVEAMLRCVSDTSRVGLWMMWRLCWGVYLAHLV